MADWDRDSVLTLIIFTICALAWTFRPVITMWAPLAQLSDTAIAVTAAFALLIIPARKKGRRFLLDWDVASQKVPWGILILIGGGLAMAKAVSDYGVAEFLIYQFGDLSVFPPVIFLLIVVTLMVFLTEIGSNVASVTALTPIFGAVAVSAGMEPLEVIIPITIAASCAFMLPVATPANTVIFGSGLVRTWQMARAGLLLNVVAIIIITIAFGIF